MIDSDLNEIKLEIHKDFSTIEKNLEFSINGLSPGKHS